MALIDKIRKARELRIEITGGHVIVARRPTDLEMIELRSDMRPRTLLRFVCGWDKVAEIDLIPGGGPESATFEIEAFIDWIGDRPDDLTKVVNGIIESYSAHSESLASAEKN